MTTRKSGLLAMMFVGMSMLAACEDKDPVVPPPPIIPTPTITLTLVPSTATLTAAGQTVQLVAVVNGSTNQAATFTSSNTSVATVNGTTGLVTAVANGVAVITAVSAADATARAASTITVSIGAVTPPANPSISIQRITVAGNINSPVNTQNTMGQIDVTLNLEVPPGALISRVETVVDGTVVVCSQSFTATGEIEIDAAGVELVCSFDTAQLDATGAPRFPNGPHTITARVISPSGTTTASTSQTLVFNNQSFVTASLSFFNPGTTTSKPCVNAGSDIRSMGGPGSQWCGGDLTIRLSPVNFGVAGNAVASATVSVTTLGAGVAWQADPDGAGPLVACRTADTQALITDGTVAPADGGAGQGLVDPDGAGPLLANQFPGCGSFTMTRTDTNAADGLSVTWSAASNPSTTVNSGGVQNLEDIISSITVNSVTVGGQAGPTCINPDPARNPLSTGTTFVCGQGSLGSGANVAFFPTVTRIDNLAPRAILFDLTPAGCTSAACFVNGGFAFTAASPATNPFFRSVDYGSDSQVANTTFSAGPSSTTLVTVTTGADIAETVTSNDVLVRANLMDGLGNIRQLFATPTGANAAGSCINTQTAATVPPAVNTACNVFFQVSSTSSQRIGVDRTAPEFDLTDPGTSLIPNNGANDGLNFSLVYRDAGVGPSGFSSTPISVKIERITPSGTVCYSATGGGTVNCSTGGNGNGFVSTSGNITPPIAGPNNDNAYFRISYFLSDAAGNNTATSVFTTLLDTSVPSAGGITAPSIITGNASTTFSAAALDNLDLGDVQPVVVYGGLIRLQENRAAVGSYGFDVFTTSATASATIPNFIRSVQNGLAAFPPQRATDVAFLLRDVAGVVDNAACPVALTNGNSQQASTSGTVRGTSTTPWPVPTPAPNGNCFIRIDPINNAVDAGITSSNTETNFTATGMTTFAAQSSAPVVCNGTGTGAGQPCPTNPSSTTLSATATGPSATFGNPFQRVNFYYRDPATGRSILIGTSTSPTVTDVGVPANRTFRWSITWTPTALGGGPYVIDVLGVDAKGQSLLAQTNLTIDID